MLRYTASLCASVSKSIRVRLLSASFAFFICVFAGLNVRAQTTEFTYQGSLRNGGVAATGNYDFEFLLFDAVMGPNQIGSTLTISGVTVTNGVFSVKLDFGANFPGSIRFLEIHVRPQMGGAFTPLTPRQAVTSAPYSVKSLSADNAATSTTATNATQLGGVAANQYVLTGDARLSDARPPTAGSSNYIQNISGLGTQANARFNISGDGNANVFDSATTFKIAGERVLSADISNTFTGIDAGSVNTGANNAFFGARAGKLNTTAINNSFFGTSAGRLNTLGDNNAFFGTASGEQNTTGIANSFFGVLAGSLNTSGSNNSIFGAYAGQGSTGSGNVFIGVRAGNLNSSGGGNAFFGSSAGQSNTTGTNNTALGDSANLGSGNLFYATAIGAGSVVSTSATVVLGRNVDAVQIPGSLNVAGTFTGNVSGAGITNLNASNITSGTLNNARLGVVPIGNGGTGSASQNFVDLTSAQTIGGNKTFSNTLSGNIVNAITQYNIGDGRVFSLGIGNFGITSVFAGINAGANTTGAAAANSFFGANTGQSNAAGSDNSFFGYSAGYNNTGSNNSVFGSNAGSLNITNSAYNSFFGFGAGQSNATGGNNTIIGARANLGGGALTFATAIGANAFVSQSNSLVLGSINGVNGATSDINVGIGTTAPLARLDVRGSVLVGLTALPAFEDFNNFHGVYLANDQGDANNYLKVEGYENALYIVARSEPGSSAGTNIIFRTATAGFGEIDRVLIKDTGVVQINNLGTAGGVQLCRNASNEISTCSSSARYKSNINPFKSGLSLIKQLHPVSFNWKNGGMLDMGLVAEEVAKVEPLLTTTNDKGEIEGVKYDRVGVVLINAVKEQQAQIEAQQKQIDYQNEIIKKQRADLDALKAIVCAQNPTTSACKQQN